MRALLTRLAVAGLALGAAVTAAAAPPTPARPAAAPPAVAKESCSTCHLEIGDERLARPVRAYADDIHRAKGFGCVACHGGDGNAAGMVAMDPSKGYIGKPERVHSCRSQSCIDVRRPPT